MQPTSISWCDYTWNPLRGCSRISEGCRNCYAEKIAARFSRHVMDSDGVGTYTVEPFHGFAEYRTVGGKREAHWTGKVELIEDKLLEPLSWRRKAAKFRAKHGRKPRCFTNSMSDLFHERLLERSIARVFASMAFAPEIDFLCLTKRADRAESILGTGRFHDQIIDEMNAMRYVSERIAGIRWPLPNIWLGVSVEDQKRVDERIPHLLRTPAAVRFLSCEPLLEEIDIVAYLECPGLDLCIVGGESGPGARPFDISWARFLRDQCEATGKAFFLKQLGSKPFEERVQYGVGPWGPAKEGIVSDWPKLKDRSGADPSEWPEDLRIQQMPEVPHG